ncbi:MAG: hypothetical protein LBC58_02865 [Clostridiales Family XIII bacterium]|jgi:hypothetical protein|nr:hypothetical protein [Clostridiales Family XIII bacterium]
MVRKVKKTLSIVGLIVCAVFIAAFLFVINALTGNPVSKAIAKNEIQKYIHEVYSADSEIKRTYYFFPERGYFSEVKIGIQTMTLKFYANRITDENVTNYFQDKFNEDYPAACESFANDYLEFPEELYIHTFVIADDNYNPDFEKLSVEQKIYLLGIQNRDKTISEDDSKNMASETAHQLIDAVGDRYNFRSIQLIYMDKFGAYEINLNDKDLTLDELSKNTRKMDDSEIGEEERAFVESLNR